MEIKKQKNNFLLHTVLVDILSSLLWTRYIYSVMMVFNIKETTKQKIL